MRKKRKAESFVGRERFLCQLQLLTGPTLSDVADQLLILANDFLQEMHLSLRNLQDTNYLMGMKDTFCWMSGQRSPRRCKSRCFKITSIANSSCKMYSSSSAESLTTVGRNGRHDCSDGRLHVTT